MASSYHGFELSWLHDIWPTNTVLPLITKSLLITCNLRQIGQTGVGQHKPNQITPSIHVSSHLLHVEPTFLSRQDAANLWVIPVLVVALRRLPRATLAMVNFSLRLRANTYAEWREDYVDYARLKHLLRRHDGGGSSSSASDLSEQQWQPMTMARDAPRACRVSFGRLVTAVRDEPPLREAPFEDAVSFELEKVERAYSRHLTQLGDHFALLRDQYRHDAPAATRESLKNALVELHRLLHQLENFALLNYTGFVKILKKRDKLSAAHAEPLLSVMDAQLQDLEFAKAKKCRELLADVETLFADRFCDGDSAVARATLLTKRDAGIDWGHVYLGIKLGACLLLLVWVGWDSLIVPTFRTERERHVIDLVLTRAYPVYRGIGGLLLLHWLMGVSLYVWRAARINYRYLFELDPRRVQSYPEVWSDATNMTIVFLTNVLLYYKVVNGYFPEAILNRGYYPLALALYTVYFYLVRPWGRQLGLLRTVWEVVASPLYAVTFLHTFVGDYMTSTVKVTQDLAWSVCFFWSGEFLRKDAVPVADLWGLGDALLTGEEDDDLTCQSNAYFVNVVVPLVCALPLWWRFLQSLRRVYDTQAWWPNLFNAFKYALTQVVALFGLFHPLRVDAAGDAGSLATQRAFLVLWLFLFTASSLYTWVWDVTMDWGLGRPQFKYLGDSQMFSRKWVYYVAIVADLFLRFAWTLTLIPPRSSRDWLPRYVAPVTMVLELFRRTFWSFFRLENEHLRNTQGFRRVDFIPLHYDHGMGSGGESDGDDGDGKRIAEPLEFKVFVAKILAVLLLVLALSVAAILVQK